MDSKTSSAFLKGYIYPQPLISKLAVNANLADTYKYIGMTFDLLQNHPEMFEKTSNNLLYIVNVNTNYRPAVIYEMFKTMIATDSILTRDQAIEILLPNLLVEDNTVLDTTIESSLNLEREFSQTACMIQLMAYYLRKYQKFNIYEPVFNNIKQAFDIYRNNPRISYNGETFDYRILKPLCYTMYGTNFFDDLVYWAYYLTFFINGRPYRFFDEIGSDSLSTRLYSSINDYFASHYKKLCKDLHINLTDDWSVLYGTLLKENQIETLQRMLNSMLDFEKIIMLRNNEMNKSTDLLDECFRDQNVLSQEFIYEAFCRNMDKLAELVIDHNPFNQFKFDVFKEKAIEDVKNYHELMQLTQLCITSSKAIKGGFEIDQDTYNFGPFQEFKRFDVLDHPVIKSSINEFTNSKIKKPFTSVDIMTQMASSYIWLKLIDRQSDGIFQSEGLGTESISIDHLSILSANIMPKLLSIFINGLYQKDYTNMNALFNFFEPITELMELRDSLRYIYPTDYYKSELLPIVIMSYFKDGIMNMILNQSVMTGNFVTSSEISNGLRNMAKIDNLQNFNLFYHVFRVDTTTEKHQLLIKKLENLLDAMLFVEQDGYARFVNATLQDLSKYLNECSIELPLVIGNDDDALRYGLGGVSLYDKMIDVNPFNRGYYYAKELFGNSETLNYFHSIVQYFDDVSRIELVKTTNSLNTVKDILYHIGENHVKQLMKHKVHRNLIEYQIVVHNDKVMAELKNFGTFVSENTTFIQNMLSVIYKNTVGSSIENKIVCVSLSPIDGSVKQISENKFGNGGICTIEETNGDIFELPLFKFKGSFESFELKYTKPTGTKLLCNGIDLLDNNGAKNLKVFVFTSAPLTSAFNMYDISDI